MDLASLEWWLRQEPQDQFDTQQIAAGFEVSPINP